MELFETEQLTFMNGRINLNAGRDFLIEILQSVFSHIIKFIDMIKTDKVRIKNLEESYEDTIKFYRYHLQQFKSKKYKSKISLIASERKVDEEEVIEQEIIAHLKWYTNFDLRYYLAKRMFSRAEGIEQEESIQEKNKDHDHLLDIGLELYKRQSNLRQKPTVTIENTDSEASTNESFTEEWDSTCGLENCQFESHFQCSEVVTGDCISKMCPVHTIFYFKGISDNEAKCMNCIKALKQLIVETKNRTNKFEPFIKEENFTPIVFAFICVAIVLFYYSFYCSPHRQLKFL